MKRRGYFIISGRVQGVCYRMYACREGARLGVTGWVRNLPDGTVEALAEGDDAALAAFRDWCGRGPPQARVTRVDVRYSEATGEFLDFEVA